jgi:hypothetical protein
LSEEKEGKNIRTQGSMGREVSIFHEVDCYSAAAVVTEENPIVRLIPCREFLSVNADS